MVGFIYILVSGRNGTLYVGVTNHCIRRVQEYRDKFVKSFTSRHQVDRLVYFEKAESMRNAIVREKQLKKWNRSWKLRLIEEANLDWRDLAEEL
jgi:putative endonuclease